jgi:hypothetical protein
MNVDREARDRLVVTINRYLDEEISAFQFDEEIFDDIWDTTDDPTIGYIISSLWYFYDDCKDHKVRLSKEAWDYFQQLILLLQSDFHMEEHTKRQWSMRQFIAAVALALFGLSIVWLGIGKHLLAIAVPFGVVSILLLSWRTRSMPQPDPFAIAITPFSSVLELLQVRRRIHKFKKKSILLIEVEDNSFFLYNRSDDVARLRDVDNILAIRVAVSNIAGYSN